MLVLDNTIGSGTTALACKRTNRSFIGMEINQVFIDIANKRLNQECL
jgi:DNA modification methylase